VLPIYLGGVCHTASNKFGSLYLSLRVLMARKLTEDYLTKVEKLDPTSMAFAFAKMNP
jgi:hypothetical protein